MSNPSNFHHYTDIRHYRKYRHLLEPGLPVRITEKIDGCQSRVGLLLVDGEWRFVAGSRSRVEGPDSVYWEPLSREGVLNLLTHVCDNWTVDGDPTNDVMIFGVLCGPEEWRAFDISVNGTYLGRSDLILPTTASAQAARTSAAVAVGFSTARSRAAAICSLV